MMDEKNTLAAEEPALTLTLTPELDETAQAQEEAAAPQAEPVRLDESSLTEAERQLVRDVAD